MRASRALVTGANDFVGSALLRAAAMAGVEATGATRAETDYSPRSLAALVDASGADVVFHCAGGASVALGFEAPLFIPVPQDASRLSRGRTGEGNRSFAAPPGLSVTTLGLHQAAWLLDRIRTLLGSDNSMVRFTQDPRAWPPVVDARVLFCWEAFVSGKAHGRDHVADAITAVFAFAQEETHLASNRRICAERPLSVIAAAALWSGWIHDLAELHISNIVIMPAMPCSGATE